MLRKKSKKHLMNITALNCHLKIRGWFVNEFWKIGLSLPALFIQFYFIFVRFRNNYNVRFETEISNEEISVACHYIDHSGQYRYISSTHLYDSFVPLGGEFWGSLWQAINWLIVK